MGLQWNRSVFKFKCIDSLVWLRPAYFKCFHCVISILWAVRAVCKWLETQWASDFNIFIRCMNDPFVPYIGINSRFLFNLKWKLMITNDERWAKSKTTHCYFYLWLPKMELNSNKYITRARMSSDVGTYRKRKSTATNHRHVCKTRFERYRSVDI